MELKTRAVKLFCAVVETGSLYAAANKMALSTSAASRALSELEAQLGFALFDRTNRTLRLTEAGQQFHRMAIESVRVWRHLEEWPRLQREPRKRLRIAVLARHCSEVILPAVARILEENRETLAVTMDVHDSRDIHYSKYSHPFDVGFGTLLTEHDDLRKVALAHLPMKFVVSRSHALASRTSVSRSELAQERFIVLSGDMPEEQYCRHIVPRLDPGQVVAQVSSTQVALRFARFNLGGHITDSLAAVGLKDECTCIDIEDAGTIPFYVFWPSSGIDLWPEIVGCIARIALSIQAQGIALTQEALGFIRQSRHGLPGSEFEPFSHA